MNLIVLVILGSLRKMADVRPHRLGWTWSVLSVAGLGSIVYGVLRTSEWGWVMPKPGAPGFGTSPSIWLIVLGLLVVSGSCAGSTGSSDAGRSRCSDPACWTTAG